MVRLCLSYPGYFALGVTALIGGVGTNLLFPKLARSVVDQMAAGGKIDVPLDTWLAMVILLAIQGIMFFLRTHAFGVLGHLVTKNLQTKVFANLLGKSYAESRLSAPADTVNRLNADTILIRDAVGIRLSVILRYSIQVIGGIVLMAVSSPLLTVFLIGSVAAFVVVSMILGRRLKKLTTAQQAALGKATLVANEALTNLAEVKVFQLEEMQKRRFEGILNKISEIGRARSRLSSVFQSAMPFLLNIALLFFVVFGLQLVAAESLTPGVLLQFTLYGVIVATSLSFIATSYGNFVQAYSAMERLQDFMTAVGDDDEIHSEGKACMGDSLGMEVQFTGVCFEPLTPHNHVQLEQPFAPPEYPSPFSIRDINLAIQPGTFCALIGASGAGKTTLANLLLTLYRPTKGEIFYDKQPGHELSLSSLRKQIACVPQNPGLFSLSITENLRGAAPDATIDEIWETLTRVNLADFVHSLPNKLDTIVGYGGHEFSGGEKQRLAIARALIKRSRLIVLDEATSALDSANERAVIDALSASTPNATVVLIAHRLSSIRRADLVAVIEAGRLVEVGPPQELIESKGRYFHYLQQ